jgi:hypothetical protein
MVPGLPLQTKIWFMRGLNSGNATNSVQNLLSSRLLSRIINITTYRSTILTAVLYGCKTRSDIKRGSQSYFRTGGLPPISSSWRQAPWDSRPENFLFNWTFAVIVLM